MNKYFEVIFKSKKDLDKEERFVISQDLINRGIVENLFVKIDGKFVKITDKATVIQWIELSDDKQLYNEEFNVIGLNDISFEDYIKIYNKEENKVGYFIIEKYIKIGTEKKVLLLSMKTDEFNNKTYCEYYDKISNKYVYTERVLGLDRVIENEQVKKYFEDYKKENL